MIYAFLADGFEEIEAIATIDVLRRAEVSVTTVGIGGRTVTGAHGITVTADIADSQADIGQADGIFLPGGMPGTLNLEASDTVQAAITHCAENGLMIAAICAAPSVIGKRGLLAGRRATCFDGFESALTDAVFTGAQFETDGNFITGIGAGAAVDFALAIVEYLKGRAAAESLRKAMKCR
ncbi:MAG: DJ-1/PfpI family protein [Firmicutes bacterium]|nr:DJ-1/PfpI family protein [Bacillota bacterium]